MIGRAAKPLAAAAVTPLPTGREYLPTGRTGFSSYYATADDDDEFDSVSQISGERAVSHSIIPILPNLPFPKVSSAILDIRVV